MWYTLKSIKLFYLSGIDSFEWLIGYLYLSGFIFNFIVIHKFFIQKYIIDWVSLNELSGLEWYGKCDFYLCPRCDFYLVSEFGHV